MVRISDIELLEILEKNARTPYTQIAKKLGVTESAIRKKIKKLEEKGVIRQYTIDIDTTKLGLIKAMIGIDTKPEHYMEIIEELKQNPQTRKIYTSSGDHMILAECWFPTTRHLREYTQKLQEDPRTTRVCPAMIIDRIK